MTRTNSDAIIKPSKMWFPLRFIYRIKDNVVFLRDIAKEFVAKIYRDVKSILLTAVFVFMILAVLFWGSVFSYGSFYYSYMPAVLHTRDVNLQFSPDCEIDLESCQFPSANLTLMPHNQPKKELLTRGQSYRITLTLEMPESPVNQGTGVFMVKLTFYTFHGEVLKTASRGTLLHYKSFLLQILETLTYYPLYMMRFKEQKQVVMVEMFSNYEESPYKPTIGAYVQVQSRRIHIYSTTLQIHARFSGLRYLLFHWPTTMAVIGISTFLYIYGIVVLLSWYKFYKKSNGKDEGNPDWVPLYSFTGTLDGRDLMQDSPGKPETLEAAAASKQVNKDDTSDQTEGCKECEDIHSTNKPETAGINVEKNDDSVVRHRVLIS